MDTRNELCKTCQKRDTCREPCPALKKAITQKGAPFEINKKEVVLLCTDKNVVRQSAMRVNGNNGGSDDIADTLTYDDLKFNTDAIELTCTAVFIERFFNKRSILDIADQLNISKKNVVMHWLRAIEMIERLIPIIDTRESGLRNMLARKDTVFSYDEKAFLLNQMFGFSTREVSEILGKSRATVKRRVNRLRDKYRAAFDQIA